MEKTLHGFVPDDQKAVYDHAAGPALDALRGFDTFLQNELPKRKRENTEPDWRLGENYATKFHLALGTDLTPEQVLTKAEADLTRVRSAMLETSKQILAAHSRAAESDPSKTITAALNLVAARRATPATFMNEARADLSEAREFVQQKNLLTLPHARQPSGN